VASADQKARSGNGISTINHYATFEVLTAVLMKIPVSWDVTLFRLVNIITGALKDNRAFIFGLKQSKKCHCLTALFFSMFSQGFNVFTTDLSSFCHLYVYIHVFSSSNSSFKAVSHLTDKMK
jgi:hypothetical protein